MTHQTALERTLRGKKPLIRQELMEFIASAIAADSTSPRFRSGTDEIPGIGVGTFGRFTWTPAGKAARFHSARAHMTAGEVDAAAGLSELFALISRKFQIIAVTASRNDCRRYVPDGSSWVSAAPRRKEKCR